MKPANLSQYESLQWDLARARGLQRVLKTRRKQIGAEIAFCNTRFRNNGGHFEGRDMVPLRAAQDMISAVRKQAAIERDIVKTRLSIRQMEARLACMKIAHAFSRTLEQVLRSIQPPTARQCLGQILRFQGLHLHDNNEISGPGGKLVGWYGDDARFIGSELKWTFKPAQALEFITLDLKLEDIKTEGDE